MKINLALIICTRNRPQTLNILLDSVKYSETKPDSVIVVSSGEDISEVIGVHGKDLQILHHHTNKVGQSNQKVIAIQMLKPETNWVFFMDDDLELMSSTLSNVYKRIELIQNQNVNGIGAHLIEKFSNFQDVQHEKSPSKRITGRIKPSGRASKYAFDKLTYTGWLNGASIWRTNCLNQYSLPILNSTYAAYEDVIFSSAVARTSNLLYDPAIILREQVPHSRVTLSFKQFKYITLWTGYLVCSRLDTKILNYKMLTVLRWLIFLSRTRIKKRFKLIDIFLSLQFVVKILRLPKSKPKSKILLIALLNDESPRF